MNSFIVTSGNHGKPWLELAFLARIRTKVYGQLSPHCDVHPNNEYALSPNCHFRRQNDKFSKAIGCGCQVSLQQSKTIPPSGSTSQVDMGNPWLRQGTPRCSAALPSSNKHGDFMGFHGAESGFHMPSNTWNIIINTWGLFQGMWS